MSPIRLTGLVAEVPSQRIRRDVHAVHERLAALDGRVRIYQRRAPFADRLDLAPGEHQSRFKPLLDEVIAQPFTVGGLYLDPRAVVISGHDQSITSPARG